MLAKEYRLTKTRDFQKVFKEGRYFDNIFFTARATSNNLGISRFGFIVGLKVSKKAVQRHKIQRQLREIVGRHLPQIKTGFDVVIAAKPSIINRSAAEIALEVINCLQKAGLYA